MPGIPVKNSSDLSLSGTSELSAWMAWKSAPGPVPEGKNTPVSMSSPLSPTCFPELPMDISFEAFANQTPPCPPTPESSSPRSLKSPKPRRLIKSDISKTNAVGKPQRPSRQPRARARRTKEAALQSEVHALCEKNKALRQQRWELENEIVALKAKILTDEDEVQSVNVMEKDLDHAKRYIRALKTQVRALGGYVFDASDDGDSSRESDDGELPASFPRAAANPSDFTMAAIRATKVPRGKKRLCKTVSQGR